MKHVMTRAAVIAFLAGGGGKYQDAERVFPSVVSCERIVEVEARLCANNYSLCLSFAFILLVVHEEICLQRRGRKAFALELLQSETTTPPKWFLDNRGSLKLTMCGEGGQMGWGEKLRRWSATHDFPSDSSVSWGEMDRQHGVDGLGAHIQLIPSFTLPFHLHDARIMGKCEKLQRDWLPRGFTVRVGWWQDVGYAACIT